jgi:hypothetical protein
MHLGWGVECCRRDPLQRLHAHSSAYRIAGSKEGTAEGELERLVGVDGGKVNSNWASLYFVAFAIVGVRS